MICFIAFIILVSIFSAISQKFGISKSKYNKLHKLGVKILVCGFIAMTIFDVRILINKVNWLITTSSSSAEGFTIEEYKIVMDVNESNSVDVKEYVTVNFYESGWTSWNL